MAEGRRLLLPLSSVLGGWGFLSALGTSGLRAGKTNHHPHKGTSLIGVTDWQTVRVKESCGFNKKKYLCLASLDGKVLDPHSNVKCLHVALAVCVRVCVCINVYNALWRRNIDKILQVLDRKSERQTSWCLEKSKTNKTPWLLGCASCAHAHVQVRTRLLHNEQLLL